MERLLEAWGLAALESEAWEQWGWCQGLRLGPLGGAAMHGSQEGEGLVGDMAPEFPLPPLFSVKAGVVYALSSGGCGAEQACG